MVVVVLTPLSALERLAPVPMHPWSGSERGAGICADAGVASARARWAAYKDQGIPRQMTFDTYGHLFPSLEDDHAKFAAGELQIVGAAA